MTGININCNIVVKLKTKDMQPIKEKQLFEIIDNIGESINDNYHIIDSTKFEDPSYRVYHSDGYCFDIKKEYCAEDDEFTDNTIDGICYIFISEYEGFKDLTVDEAINLIK